MICPACDGALETLEQCGVCLGTGSLDDVDVRDTVPCRPDYAEDAADARDIYERGEP